jgi:hypothetical protein
MRIRCNAQHLARVLKKISNLCFLLVGNWKEKKPKKEEKL